MAGCSSCGGTAYIPGGGSEPVMVYDVVVDGKVAEVVTKGEGGLNEALRRSDGYQAAGHQAKVTAQRA